MSRAATTSDTFNAIAEPRRRAILSLLAVAERPVGDIVASLGFEQPSVSKHLRVLHEVGLVSARRDGRRMLYRTNAEGIRPLHDWASTFERFWNNQLLRLEERGDNSPTGEDMNLAEQAIDNLTLNVQQEIHVRAPLKATFDALLEQLGPYNEAGEGRPRTEE